MSTEFKPTPGGTAAAISFADFVRLRAVAFVHLLAV